MTNQADFYDDYGPRSDVGAEHARIIAADFIAENWGFFEDFCQQRCANPDEIYKAIKRA